MACDEASKDSVTDADASADDDGLAVRTVLTSAPLPVPLSYLAPAWLKPGSLVTAPLGGRSVTGAIWDDPAGDAKTSADAAPVARDKLKPIEAVLDAPALPTGLRRLIDWTARYLMAPPGATLRLALPRAALAPAPMRTVYRLADDSAAQAALPDVRLTPKRRRALDALQGLPAMPAKEAARIAGVGEGVIKGLADAGFVERAKAPVDPLPEGLTPTPPPVLSAEQARVAGMLSDAVRAKAFSVTLLDGVTGSGKTVVYMEAIAAAVETGRQTLCMVPEIALTGQWLDRFADRFGARPIVWHSELGAAARRAAWRAVATGQARVVIGARSALFLPFVDLGLIVVDEEHEAAYKQDDGVRYHGRDLAVVRGRFDAAAVILASATPSLETMANVTRGRYGVAVLPRRHAGAKPPDASLIDLRKTPPERGRWLAGPLVEAVDAALADDAQALLFLNRRGYAPLTLCRACGSRIECPSCAAWLVEHRLHGRLICHHCGHSARLPSACDVCGAEDQFAVSGPGVERVAEEAAERWPDAVVEIASSDTLAGPAAIRDFALRMAAGEIQIAVGTQILAKGHHFPGLTVAGVVDGDLGLGGGDLRAAERTYQMLTQAAGRTGRADRPGRAFIQTHQPEHPVMQAIAAGDRAGFIKAESAARKAADMPPYGRLVALIVSARDPGAAEAAARRLARTAPAYREARVYGPAPAPLAQLRGNWRWRLLLHANREVNVQAVLAEWLRDFRQKDGVRLAIDVDPYSFL